MVEMEMTLDIAQKAAFYEFVKGYLNQSANLFEHDQPTSDFSRGYQKSLMSLKSVLDAMEKSAKIA
jgi:hypothetical protein